MSRLKNTGIMPKRGGVKLEDIASASGFGRATVARALSRDSKYPLAPATREQIRRIANELGYAPSWSGRVLATGRTGQIGLVYAGTAPITAGILGQLLQTIPDDLAKTGHRIVHVPVPQQPGGWNLQEVGRSLDGCLILPPSPPALAVEPEMPTVLINLEMDLPIPRVLADDRAGAVELTRHLLGLGHRRIAFLHPSGPQTHYSSRLREDGCVETARAGGAVIEVLAATPAEALAQWLRQSVKPTAVICYENMAAINLLQACWRAGISVPQRLSVACFNDIWPTEACIPPLTTVRVPMRDMAHHAIRLLLDMLAGERGGGAAATVILPESLVIRESTATPAADR